jgi:hypothetical protein
VKSSAAGVQLLAKLGTRQHLVADVSAGDHHQHGAEDGGVAPMPRGSLSTPPRPPDGPCLIGEAIGAATPCYGSS